jgi:hypothetical protein
MDPIGSTVTPHRHAHVHLALCLSSFLPPSRSLPRALSRARSHFISLTPAHSHTHTCTGASPHSRHSNECSHYDSNKQPFQKKKKQVHDLPHRFEGCSVLTCSELLGHTAISQELREAGANAIGEPAWLARYTYAFFFTYHV